MYCSLDNMTQNAIILYNVSSHIVTSQQCKDILIEMKWPHELLNSETICFPIENYIFLL